MVEKQYCLLNMPIKFLQQYLKLEEASGAVLLVMTLISLLWANSPLAPIHQKFIDAFLFWINEGLMAVFFLGVGLELKRGYFEGHLARFSQILLPIVAALGGMLMPALIYMAINFDHPAYLKGWATPVATDIAFALGVLALFAKRLPLSLKLFLTTLAIFDDLGAIIIIAIFYSSGLSFFLIFQSAVLVLILYLFNRLTIRSLVPYLLIGVWLWLSLVHSGIHPTISGVLLALMIPNSEDNSLLNRLETKLRPWIAFVIMPLFALANAGFSLEDVSWQALKSGIVLGIISGLVIGKQVGVFGFSWLCIKSGLAKLPKKSTWSELYGTAILCGIGFTMSLFLGTLSFQNKSPYVTEVRLGVLLGSLISGCLGASVLLAAVRKKNSGSH